ncbi:MAG: hypothetical protein JOS17DRAFT_766280 [Linnemannia elongata]|nr:MAG: hypothetical protein JOS17DRAFT_766280 [Linnemannia elongata]
MHSSLVNTESRHTMDPSTSTQRTGLELPSPLDIPELLDRVLSYMDQRTLSYNCTRVSRLWFEIARQYVELEYAWSDCLKDSEDLERALTLLPRMTRLQWFSGSAREAARANSQKLQRALLLNALETVEYNRETPRRSYDQYDLRLYDELKSLTPLNTTGKQLIAPPGQIAQGPITQLRTLELCGDVSLTWFRLLLPLLSTLTRMKISTAFGKASTTRMVDEYIAIHDILQDCPLLEELHIIATRGEWLYGPWVRRAGSLPFSSVPDTLLPHFQLRSLVIERGSLTRQYLEALLTRTPHLTTLILHTFYIYYPEVNIKLGSLDRTQFLKKLQELNLPLEVFSCSRLNNSGFSSICPTSQVRIFYTEDLHVQHVQLLEHQPNNITFLELHAHFTSAFLPLGHLHHYLCASPHLLHLKALGLPFHIEHMDLHGLLPPITDQSRPVYLPGVWQCRKLRTLHIRIATPTNDAGFRPPPMPEHSRIAFGYIARVCPELREIEFANGGYDAEDTYLNLTLLGGLCLLGRLQHLERFSAGTWEKREVLNAHNLEWIVECGRTETKKAMRQDELRSVWKELGLLDVNGPVQDAATVARQDPQSLASMFIKGCASLNTEEGGQLESTARFDWAGVDANLREELRYLGLPVEVKTFFDELDKPGKDGGGYNCFPVLRYLSFCSPGGIRLSPEREIKRLTVNVSRRPWIKLKKKKKSRN